MTAVTEFSMTLLHWFRQNGRDLPWRGTKDPYAIWLSEIILQQTQVKQGWDYWQRFMARWPKVEMLAAATEDEVLRAWQGLGYYSRARHLHEAARQIVAMGAFPNTYEGIRSLKGVGDYTAAAIGSIAFGLPVAVVDGNVYRVLSRYFDVDTPINTTDGKRVFSAMAQALLPPPEACDYNQAIMDFGAMVCTPQSPRCSDCPLVVTCKAFRQAKVGILPVKRKTLKVKERRLCYVMVRCAGYVAIHRRGEGDIWQGLWEPVRVDDAKELNIWLERGAVLWRQDVKHVLTHRILLADCYLCELDERPPLPPDYHWIPEDQIDSYALPRLLDRLWHDLVGT